MDEQEKGILGSAMDLLDVVEKELLEGAARRVGFETEDRRYERYGMLMGLARAKGLIRDATLPEDERVWKGHHR